METVPPRPPPPPPVIAAFYVGGFAALVGSFYAVDAALTAFVLTPMCRRDCRSHAGLAHMDFTGSGRSAHCVCACNDGAAIRNLSEPITGLTPLILMVLALLVGGVVAAVISIRKRLRRGRDAAG